MLQHGFLACGVGWLGSPNRAVVPLWRVIAHSGSKPSGLAFTSLLAVSSHPYWLWQCPYCGLPARLPVPDCPSGLGAHFSLCGVE